MIEGLLIARIIEVRETLHQTIDKPLCIAIHGHLSASTSMRPRSIQATIQHLALGGRSYRLRTFNVKSVRRPCRSTLTPKGVDASVSNGEKNSGESRSFPHSSARVEIVVMRAGVPKAIMLDEIVCCREEIARLDENRFVKLDEHRFIQGIVLWKAICEQHEATSVLLDNVGCSRSAMWTQCTKKTCTRPRDL